MQRHKCLRQDLQIQLENLLAKHLALTENCKNHKYTIADLKAKLNVMRSGKTCRMSRWYVFSKV